MHLPETREWQLALAHIMCQDCTGFMSPALCEEQQAKYFVCMRSKWNSLRSHVWIRLVPDEEEYGQRIGA